MKKLVIGVGCRKGLSCDKLESEIISVFDKNSLSINDVKIVASIDIKKDERGIIEFAKKHNIEFKTFSSEELSIVSKKFCQSNFVKGVTGIGNVCESAAYLASGKGKCILNKTLMDKATLSIYEMEEGRSINNILIIGGTTEARKALDELSSLANIYLSVATQYGADIVDNDKVNIICGRMDSKGFSDFIKSKNIDLVVDMSHPFAVRVSEEVKKACIETDTILMDYSRNNISYEYENIFYCNDFEEAANRASHYDGNIFLTIGANNIAIFTKVIEPNRIVARVLEVDSSINACLENGVPRENIIAEKGPFSYEENLEAFLRYNAAVIVSKDSGLTGGVDKKIKAAEELGIPAILVARPHDNNKDKICVTSVDEIRKWIISQYNRR